jgi:predicted enzyme related to lactoylglutathione lyase
MAEDWARPVVHWDIQARDPAKARAFYTQMFNWDIADGPLMAVPAGIGGPPPEALSGNILRSEHTGISLYVQVRDLAESLERAPALGGTVITQAVQVPNGPTIAAITDPEGNRLVLVQQ